MRTGDGERLRQEKLKRLLLRPWALALLVLVPCLVLVYGASRQSPLLAFGGSVAVLVAMLGGAYAWAQSSARRQVVEAFAAAHGLAVTRDAIPPSHTPLLRAGDEREMDLALTGSIDGMPVLVGHYTYTDIRTTTDSEGRTRQERDHHRFTIAVTEVQAAAHALPALYLRPKKFLGFGSGWLNTRGLDECETESVRFNERFRVWHREGQDPMVLRRMLDPSNVDALAGHPLGVGVELAGGHLLVYVEGHCGDTGELRGLVGTLAQLRGWAYAAARVDLAAAAGPPAA